MIFGYRVDGCQITEEDRELIEAKLSKLQKLDNRLSKDDDTVKFHVNVFRGTRHHSPNYALHVQLTFPGNSLRAKASGKTIPDAADEVERKLRVQVGKLKN
ncbi:MAG: HPF/RaiA family ribosome-associated protein [Patescibacteria group bacterium]